MNILSVTNALKEIKLSDLDDEFQTTILSRLNIHMPEGTVITTEVNGNELRSMIDEISDPFTKLKILELNLIDNRDIVRFFNNVEKIQQNKLREVEYDDAIKGNFFSTLSFFCIIFVLILMGIYTLTPHSRGTVPESQVLGVIEYAVRSMSELHQVEEIPPETTEGE